MTPDQLVGRPVDGLTTKEQVQLAGHWVALELYSPATLPLRTIAAVGGTQQECLRALRERGLNPEKFELVAMKRPF